MFSVLLLLPILPLNRAEECAACPTGGLWSEWSSTGTCATDCGACSTLKYTRTCLSESGGCSCDGDTSKIDICRPEVCNFSRSNSDIAECCNGTSMIIDNLYKCGPLPDAYTLDCCPSGGYWSPWSSYSKKTDKIAWNRSRTCISLGHSCPCEGDSEEVTYACPCTEPLNIPASDTTCQGQIDDLSGYMPAEDRVSRPQLTPIPSRCIAYTMLEVTNFIGDFVVTNDGELRTVLVSMDGDGNCKSIFYDAGLTEIYTNGVIQRVEFACNFETLKYELSGTTITNITKFSQFYKSS